MVWGENMLKREKEILIKFQNERAVYSNALHHVFDQEYDLSTIVKMCNEGLLINDGETVRLTKKGNFFQWFASFQGLGVLVKRYSFVISGKKCS